MKNQKKVFVIRGSEDGNINVVSSMTKAYNRCFKYASADCGVEESKSHFLKNLSIYGIAVLTREGDWKVSASAERFYLNQESH